MPFKSTKQKKFMFANHPEIAKKWAHEEKKVSPKKKYSKEAMKRYGL